MLGVVSLTVFAVVGLLLHWSLQEDLRQAEQRELEDKMEVVQHYIAESINETAPDELRHHLDDVLIGSGTLRVWVQASGGTMLYGGAQMPGMRVRADGRLFITREDGVELSGLMRRNLIIATATGASVLVGVDNRGRKELLFRHDRTTALACAIGVALTMLFGSWLVRRGLRPVKLLADEAEQITPDALGKRLEARPQTAELMPLVASFNLALDRIDEAYQQLQGFSADVAHELRTPLATLISGAEVALSRTRPQQELQDLLASNLDDLRALASMVNDMLFLAHADRGEVASNLALVSVRAEVLAVVEYLESSLEEADRAVVIEGDVQATVNAPLLRRAVVNLVANAIRYAAAGHSIVVRLDEQGGLPSLSVSNVGPPVLKTDRVFDRFWRGDAARSESFNRHGLGLAIVRAIARMHGGDTFVRSAQGLTTFGFTLARRRDLETRSVHRAARSRVD